MSPPSSLRARQLTWVVEVGDVPPYRSGPYEKHLNHSKYEREDVQKKTFAKWINSQLAKHGKPLVDDLFQDLRDGEVLLSLLEILTAQQFKRERGRMRVHHLNNVNAALRALASAGVRLVNISSGDIVDGNPKLILGLVWSIILHWQVHYHLKELMSELQQTNLEKTLLAWCRNHTQDYVGVKVENFTSSWSDGLAFSALLHRFRPELFRYEEAVTLSAAERLERAFALAHQHLAIDRLLDPEDVNTPNPDKKSIMMYVMCLFQSLPHPATAHRQDHLGQEQGDGDEIGSPGDLGAEAGGSRSTSRPLSAATTCSVELGAYGAALEDALAALLLGEERLRDAPPPSPPGDAAAEQPPGRYLVALKDYFHEHERFLLELSEQQWRVGGVLEEGGRLLREAALARDEAAEVRLQLRLLARRWEALRGAAMARQAELHRALMRTQHDHLQRFRRWLTATEDRMSRMQAAAAPAAAALEAARALHADLRRQQPLVDALADCVLVVDDDDERSEHAERAPSPADVTEMEDELRALGERWSHACHWTLARLQQLQRGAELERRADELRDKVLALEKDLKQMEAYPAQEIGEVLQRVRALQRCGGELSARRSDLAELLRSLDDAEHAELAAPLAERADQCADRLDALDLILRVQADRIRELGFDVDVEEGSEGAPGAGHVSKKPRLERRRAGADFQAGHRAFAAWADEAEGALRACAERLQAAGDAGEARALLQRITRESEERRADFGNVEEIQRRLAADRELAEEAKLHARSIEELKERWEGIQKMLLDIRNTLNLLEDKENFYKNVESVESHLEDVRAWKDRMLKEPATNNQLIHLRNRIRTLKQLEIKLKELNAQSIILLTKAISKTHKDEVEADTRRINEAFEESLLYLTKREVEIKIALNKKLSPVQTEDEFKSVQKKIREMEAQIISEHAILSTRDVMMSKLDELRVTSKRFDDLQTTYDAVVRDKRSEVEKGSLEELNLRSSVENLVLRFDDAKTLLGQKLDKLENGIALLERLEDDQSHVEEWLRRLQSFLEEGDAPLGELRRLEEALDRSNKFEEEKANYRTRLENIEEMKRKVLEDCDEALARSLKEDAARKRFESLTENALKRNEELRRALERTEGLFVRIDDLEEWLRRLREDTPRGDESVIEDSAQLYQMKMRFQGLRDRCDDKTDEFRNLNEDGNEMLLRAGAPAVARRLTQLNARWTTDTHAVYERYKVLAEAWLEAGELRAWLSAEAAWLDGLQRRLAPGASRAARADAEDISDELYDLENYIANRDEDRVSRIEAVGRQLADAHIMTDWIRSETDELARRWDELRGKAAERSGELEAAATEAARCEVALDTLRQWLAEHGDEAHTPSAAECAERRAALGEVRAQEEAHRAAGRREAAERLREQLQMAERELESLERRARSPAGSELAGRLRRASAALEEVQRAAGELCPRSPDPDDVRAQLRACLRFYRTLSEMKAEVESIIKTGRRAVEEGRAERPAELTRDVDALKDAYNRLGAHVTDAKGRLEAALLAARELQADLAALGAWLRGAAGAAGRHKLELEMSRMAAIRDKLGANAERLARSCGEARLVGLRAELARLDADWERLRRQAAGDPPATPVADDSVPVEYENVTDTIKRRLESPVGSPETERPELKRSRIPLAVRSPAPVKREVRRCGAGSDAAPPGRPATDDAGPASLPGSPPDTPDAPRKESSTFNLLEDSDLFTQISKNAIVPTSPSASEATLTHSYHVVEVKEHEIVKSRPSPVDTVDTVEAVLEFVPRPVDAVEVVNDTDGDDGDGCARRGGVARLGDGPTTFVVEVKTLEQRREPTIGILVGARPDEDRTRTGLGGHERDEYRLPDDARDSEEGSLEGIYTEPEDGKVAAREPLSTSTPVKRPDAEAEPRLGDDAGSRGDRTEVTPAPSEGGPAEEISAIEEDSVGDEEDDEAAAAGLEADGERMMRRLKVALLTLAAVRAERDPAKRLEILKHQLGGVAPDAAALISRGDSLVYRLAGGKPALARKLQEAVQGPLRERWSALRAEAEERRAEALRAEDELGELRAALDALRAGTAPVGGARRLRELSAALHDGRVAFPERDVADALADYERRREEPPDAEERSEPVTRCNLSREAVSRTLARLRSAPLAGGDYDDFPLQEDALLEIKTSIDDIDRSLEEIDRRGVGGAQGARVRDKLRNEMTQLRNEYEERYGRWRGCADVWARLYAALEDAGQGLDLLLADLQSGERHAPEEWERRLEACRARSREASSLGGAVAAACAGSLGERVRSQLRACERRTEAAEEGLLALAAAPEAPDFRRAGPATSATLARVRELLLTTSAHPADAASLAVRHSLVKLSIQDER